MVPFWLLLLLLELVFAHGYVLKLRATRDMTKAVSEVGNDVAPLNTKHAPMLSDSSQSGEVQSLLIRMFEPKQQQEEVPKIPKSLQKQQKITGETVDVDIVPMPLAESKLVEKEMSQLNMEEREIRRKPRAKSRPSLRAQAKMWTAKRKSVKLPPLQHFQVPATARAAPTVRAEGNELGGMGSMDKSARMQMAADALVPGRQFWVNALKTLLMEFRRMHPEIAIDPHHHHKGSAAAAVGIKENRVEATSKVEEKEKKEMKQN